MRILLQHPHSDEEISGVKTFVNHLSALLKRDGHEVDILSTKKTTFRTMNKAVAAADIVHLSSHSFMLWVLAKWYSKPVIQHYNFPFWGTWKSNQEEFQLGFWEAGWVYFSKIIWSHGKGARTKIWFWKHWLVSVGRMILRVFLSSQADIRVVCSEFLKKDIQLPYTTEMIPNVYDFSKCDDLITTPLSDLPIFGFVGRLVREKGVLTLVHAFKQLIEKGIMAKLYIIGDGLLLESIKQLIVDLKLEYNVELLGKLNHEETAIIMAKCWSLIVPSEYEEAAAYVIVEAHASKRAVIGSNRGGTPEQVGPGGLIFEAGNIEALLEHMVFLAQNKSMAIEYGQKGYAYNLERMGNAKKFLALYERLLKAKRKCKKI